MHQILLKGSADKPVDDLTLGIFTSYDEYHLLTISTQNTFHKINHIISPNFTNVTLIKKSLMSECSTFDDGHSAPFTLDLGAILV